MSDPLKHLQQEIEEARAASTPPQASSEPAMGLGPAMRLALELVAGIATGAFIGYWVDRWLNAAPLFLIIFFFVGAAAGFRNIFREAKKMSGENAKEG